MARANEALSWTHAQLDRLAGALAVPVSQTESPARWRTLTAPAR
jgi:hypothetical protein